MPKIQQEDLKRYNFDNQYNNHIDDDDKPYLTIQDHVVKMKYQDNFILTYDEKSLIKEGFFKGYILRFIYENTLHLCHPKDFFNVLVYVDKYNLYIKQLHGCNKELQNIIKLKDDILDKSERMYNDSFIQDKEMGAIQDLVKEITHDITGIQKQYNIFDESLLKPIL